jgi:tRNA A-37 threonylcarbamoyl transferase component Bud32/membrane-associated phospholipid phosphatase
MTGMQETRETHDDVAEQERFLPIGRRRRPAGDARPHPFRFEGSSWTWLVLAVAVLATWAALFATGAPAPWLERLDVAVLDAAVRSRTSWLTGVMRFVAAGGSVWAILVLRWAIILALAVTQRLRHLAVFVVVAFTVRAAMLLLSQTVGRPRPVGLAYAYGWEGYAHPSRPVAALAVALVGGSFALAPAGRPRRIALWVGGVAIALLAVARVYLGVDHPSDVLFAAIVGVAVPVIAFRVFCPDDIFPVTYGDGSAAHEEIQGPREEALRTGLEEQAGLELVEVEALGDEGSGGSTPLRVKVRSAEGREEELFAKLYTQNHLRSDRWYKLGRAIRYGALEDEVSFNSVRQLVEHEDHMLRVMNDGGIPTVRPRGFIELVPEREYVILMTFLRGAEEADEQPAFDDAVIDDGLRVVEKMWQEGIAHRDIKPSNVMIRDGRVHLIDVSFAQMRSSPWRQVVDLANMMLVLSLGSTTERVYGRAVEIFEPDEVAEAFAATRGITMPRQLRERLREDGRDLVAEFRALAPHAEPIAIQRWSVRRLVLTARTAVVVGPVAALVLWNLAAPSSP